MKGVYAAALVLIVLASACKPDPLSDKVARQEIAESCSNFVVGLTRIVRIEHINGEIDAEAAFEYVNSRGGIERREEKFAYKREHGWMPVLDLTAEAQRTEERRAQDHQDVLEAGAKEKAKLDRIETEAWIKAHAKPDSDNENIAFLLDGTLAHQWSFKSGKTVTGYFLSADTQHVLISTKDREHYKLPIQPLTDADQALIAELKSKQSSR